MIDLAACDLVFLSYDEPNADAHFEHIFSAIPRAKRVHGVKGFDAAHQRVAEVTATHHVIVIDGDNFLLDPEFLSARFDVAPRDQARVFSFSARNTVNGLLYGNGGVKIWPRSTLFTLQTHENAARAVAAVDFCWTVPYYQVTRPISEAVITGSDFQAFRGGFREGVKLNIADGKIAYEVFPGLPKSEALIEHVGPHNFERLQVWCSVGLDVERGDWAIFGARLGCAMAALDGFDIARVADYAWMDDFWDAEIAPKYSDARTRAKHTLELGDRLNDEMELGVRNLDPAASAGFKRAYRAHRAHGAMRVV